MLDMRAGKLEELAVEAATLLLYEALLCIRATAYTGKVQGYAETPSENDPSEWIRLLADACHNLPPSIHPSVSGGRRHRVTAALVDLAETASPAQRTWIEDTLRRRELEPSLFGF